MPEDMAYGESMHHHSDKDVGYGAESSFLTWHGYLNFEFDDAQGTHSNFDNHEFYLSAKSYLSERVTLTAEFEFEHTPEKLIPPIQAYADYKINKFVNFRAGLFFTPMGISRSYNLRGNKNRMIRQVGLTHDIMFENWSVVGVNLFGQLDNGIHYDIAVGNGLSGSLKPGDSFFDAVNTLQDHTEDNNANKAIHSRVGYQTNHAGGILNFGASFGTQKYDPLGQLSLIHTGFDVRYLHKSGWRLQSEFMKRSGDDNPVDLERGVSADAFGWYTQVSRRIILPNDTSYIEPVVQVDWIDLDTDVPSNKDRLTTAVGLIYSPEPNYLLKFEYDFVQERSGIPFGNNKLWAALVVEF